GKFLVKGDRRESDLLTKGIDEVELSISKIEGTTANLDQLQREKAKQLLEALRTTEKEWAGNFAAPLMEKRRQVDGGSATVAELQISYLQANPGQEQQRELEPTAQLTQIISDAVKDANDSDRKASSVIYVFTIGGTLAMILLGYLIARRVSQSITYPLAQLIGVSTQIADAGDLDQRVDIKGEDEVARLSLTFNNMVLYLREMAGLSESIAGGALSWCLH